MFKIISNTINCIRKYNIKKILYKLWKHSTNTTSNNIKQTFWKHFGKNWTAKKITKLSTKFWKTWIQIQYNYDDL